MGSWSFALSDPAGGRAVGADLREVDATSGADLVTNFYPDEGMRAREFVPVRGPVEGARLRYTRARQRVIAGT